MHGAILAIQLSPELLHMPRVYKKQIDSTVGEARGLYDGELAYDVTTIDQPTFKPKRKNKHGLTMYGKNLLGSILAVLLNIASFAVLSHINPYWLKVLYGLWQSIMLFMSCSWVILVITDIQLDEKDVIFENRSVPLITLAFAQIAIATFILFVYKNMRSIFIQITTASSPLREFFRKLYR